MCLTGRRGCADVRVYRKPILVYELDILYALRFIFRRSVLRRAQRVQESARLALGESKYVGRDPAALLRSGVSQKSINIGL